MAGARTSARQVENDSETSRKLEAFVKRAPQDLSDRMKAALEDLAREMPEAKSGDLLSSRVTV